MEPKSHHELAVDVSSAIAQRAAKKAARAAKQSVPPSAVTRQMSRNLVVLPAVAPAAFQSVADFMDAYTTTDKTIADLTAEFVVKAGDPRLMSGTMTNSRIVTPDSSTR
jgi:hypothetical protein